MKFGTNCSGGTITVGPFLPVTDTDETPPQAGRVDSRGQGNIALRILEVRRPRASSVEILTSPTGSPEYP